MRAVKRIVVIGAGTMGNGIAQTAAISGFQVTMTDVFPEALARGEETVRRSIEKLAEKGRITPAEHAAALELGTSLDLDRQRHRLAPAQAQAGEAAGNAA